MRSRDRFWCEDKRDRDKLERVGYEGIAEELGVETLAVEAPAERDPFTDTTIESNPFADPLA